jgi:mRNA-degrading endonuclease toxin of MazEF toxin-antitoxin module
MSDFDGWNILKKKVNQKELFPPVKEGEIWWCHLGQNIGIESFGKGRNFSRPVLIIKKHNANHLIIIPATKSKNRSPFHYTLNSKRGNSSFLISQIRTIDTKRLYEKIHEITNEELNEIKKAVYEINFQ